MAQHTWDKIESSQNFLTGLTLILCVCVCLFVLFFIFYWGGGGDKNGGFHLQEVDGHQI